MLTPSQIAALRNAVSSAQACEQKTGCPAALSVAQWALESGWGKFAPGNNCFGIKFYAGAFGSQTLATHEYVAGKSTEQNLEFATFPTLEACFEKHAELIAAAGPYRAAFANFARTGNVEQLVRDIAPHYAPGNPLYIKSVLSILHMPAIQAALAN